MSENDEWKKLPTLAKVQHQQWKARLEGYTEAKKLFSTQTSETAPVFNEYVGVIKKFVTDPNAVALESALDAVLLFLENAAVSGKCAGDVCTGLIAKCLSSPRAKTRDKAIECLLQIVENEKHEVAGEELLKGLSNKNPKVVVGCLQTLREILNLFGPKVVPMKALFKELPRLFDDRDKNVRGEAKNMVVEIHRWIGQASKNLFSELKPVVVTELNAILDELPPEKPTPTRYLRSQKPKEQPESETGGGRGQSATSTAAVGEAEEGLDFIDPVNVLAQVPAEYWTLITEKKWQERQQALEALEKVTNVPLIAPGDFADLIRSLLHVVNKDTNIVLATMATKILGQLASGLRKKYAPYAQQTILACLQKFKERKPTVIAALRDTIDATAKTTTLDAFVDDVVAALGNKSPSIRSETALFLSRVFSRCTQATLTKKLLKAFVTPLCNTSVDTVPEVRENSFAALGTAMRVVGAKNIEPFLADLDAIRMNKIKEYSEKATSEKSEADSATSRPGTAPSTAGKPRRGAPPIQRPGTATSKTQADDNGDATSEAQSSAPKSTAPKRKPGASGKSTTGAASSAKSSPATETLISDEQVLQKACDVFGEELINKLTVPEWKERCAGMTELIERTKALGSITDCPLQVLCRIVLRKPGLKDTNFQVLRLRIEHIQYVLESSKSVSSTLAELLVPELLEKIGDVKVGDVVRSTLTTLAERSAFDLVGSQVLQSVFQAKNPKTQADCLLWLTQSIQEFGLKLRSQDLISTIRTGLNATNPAVRQASLSLAGVVHLFMGDAVRNLFSEEKPAVVALLSAEFDKNAGKKPPAPTRGAASNAAASTTVGAADEDASETAAPEEEIDTEALLPRVDIRDRISANMLSLLTSKSWKERQEGLTEIQNVLNSAKYIEGSNGALQEPLSAVAKVCGDVNKNLCKLALQLLTDFAKALPKADAAKYVRFVEPSILLCFGDSKPQIREAAMTCLLAWQSRVPFTTMIDPELLTDAMKVENAFLRTDFLRWLSSAFADLPSNHQRRLPPDFTSTLMPYVFATMEDRNPDARKQAQLILPQLVRVLGWDGVSKAANKLKATSKDAVMPHLEKAREAVVATEPPAKETSRTGTAPKAIRGGGGESKPEKIQVPPPSEDTEEAATSPTSSSVTSPTGKKKVDGKKGSRATASKKPVVEEPAAAPLLQSNKNAKSARMNDEKKRKLLKWDFDAPTRDHVQQLNQLFLNAGASADLHALLFHADFKQHVKALDQLTRFLDTPEGEEATLANLDLLLRWIVLRFFETNPVVVGRCLDYLIKLFSRMSDSGASLSEYEATAFLPYLVLKVGDSKDAVRQNVRSLFKLVVNLYAPSRLFVFVSNGLKSKTNKTRQECLEEMGSLIDRFGVNVCQPSVPVALKSIAQQIGDRDSGVRSAALNALVSAYSIIGEQLWKLVGSLSDKDRSMLEERIKRAGRQPSTYSSEVSEARAPSISSARGNRDSSASRRPVNSARIERQPPLSTAQARAQEMLRELGDLSPEKAPNMPALIQLESEIDDLFKPIEMPTLKTQARQPILTALLRTSPDTASAITMVVTAISSSDLLVSCRALAELDTVLRDPKWYLLLNHVDQILMLITMQLRQVTTRYFGEQSLEQLPTFLRCHLAAVDSLFQHSTLAREASPETLRELIQSLLHLLLDDRTSELPDGENVIRAINSLCVRIIDAANSTRVLSALIRLLHESVSNGYLNNRFVQAIMKSLWRIIKAMDTTVNTYSLGVILLDCHHFLKAFPSASWKQRKSDVPLRTIKTMLHVLCRLRGSAILEFLENIPNKEESELEAYLLRTLKAIGGGGATVSGSHSRRPSGNESHAKATKLSEIFKKLASEEPQEAMNELYDFTQAYPETDLSAFLSKSSSYFQTYIKQGLRNISMERSRQAAGGDSNRLRSSFGSPLNGLTDLTNSGSSGQPVNTKVFKDRLAMLRRELGLGGVSTTNVDESSGLLGPPPQVLDSEDQDSKLPTNDDEAKTKMDGSSATTSEDLAQSDQRAPISADEWLEIKMRLERIKSGQLI